MAKFIRVDVPVGSPDNTLKLAKKVSDKHTALGAGSPLTGFVDMTAFETNRVSAALLQKAGDDADNTAQAKYNQCTELCGIGHATMRSSMRVVTPEAFKAWVAHKKAEGNSKTAGAVAGDKSFTSSSAGLAKGK